MIHFGATAAQLKILVLISIAFVSVAWPFWFVWGLHYTNSDDISFGHIAWNPSLDWWSYADFVARGQRRIQGYFGMPLVLLGNLLVERPWGDVVLAGQVGLFFVTLLWATRGFMPIRIVVLTSFMMATCFSVHYYFGAPPGYSLMGMSWPIFLLISIGTLRRSLSNKSKIPSISLIFFGLSLLGPEYNFILTIIPILFIIAGSKNPVRDRARYAAAYILILLIVSALYILVRVSNSISSPNVSMSFSLEGFLTAAYILIGKAFLPTGLLMGIKLPQATVGGLPDLPSNLDLIWLAQRIGADPLYLVVFLIFGGIFTFLLGGKALGARRRSALMVCALAMLFIPVSVLSMTEAYQMSVGKGYLQGHLASSYVQAGTIVLLVCLFAGWRGSLKSRLLFSIPLAALSIATLSYNLAMRDAMSANRQKWDAFALIAVAAPPAPIYGPDFWLASGVSNIPTAWYAGTHSYWGDYARFVLGIPLTFRDQNESAKFGDTLASYMASPDGSPVAYLNTGDDTVLLARRPSSLRVITTHGTSVVDEADWQCEPICKYRLINEPAFDPATDRIEPLISAPKSLFAWVFVPRSGAYGGAPRELKAP